MNPEPPPLADPHSAAPVPRQKLRIPQAKGAALPMLVALGCLALAFGVAIVLAAIGSGVEPLLSGRVSVIDPGAVVGTTVIAAFGVLCCWGGFHFLRLAFGNEWKEE